MNMRTSIMALVLTSISLFGCGPIPDTDCEVIARHQLRCNNPGDQTFGQLDLACEFWRTAEEAEQLRDCLDDWNGACGSCGVPELVIDPEQGWTECDTVANYLSECYGVADSELQGACEAMPNEFGTCLSCLENVPGCDVCPEVCPDGAAFMAEQYSVTGAKLCECEYEACYPERNVLGFFTCMSGIADELFMDGVTPEEIDVELDFDYYVCLAEEHEAWAACEAARGMCSEETFGCDFNRSRCGPPAQSWIDCAAEYL